MFGTAEPDCSCVQGHTACSPEPQGGTGLAVSKLVAACRMEQYGNEHFNMERVLRENISDNEYMRRTARPMATMKEVTDEVYSVVDHVEPWMSGNLRGPSTAFCLLYRLFELKPTVKEIQDALGSRDSPFIRAVRARLLYTPLFLFPCGHCPRPDCNRPQLACALAQCVCANGCVDEGVDKGR